LAPGQKVLLNPAGLFTNVNQLGKVPPGSLLVADNSVISKPGVIEARRGREVLYFTNELIGNTEAFGVRVYRFFNAKLRIGGDATNGWLGNAVPGIISVLADGDILWSSDGNTFTKVVPVLGQTSFQLSPADGSDRHWYAFEQNGTIYINTINGLIAIGRPVPNAPTNEDLIHSGWYPAGVPAGLSMKAELLTAVAGTAINPDSQVAYHFCFGRRDASGIVHLGAPTTRAVVVNDQPVGGTVRDAELSTIIPPGINTNTDFYQLYRSLPSPSKDVDPGDDCGLIYEGQLAKDSTIRELERTTNVVTVMTGVPGHNYKAGQEISIQSTINIPGGPNNAFLSMVPSVVTPSNLASRSVLKKNNDTGAWSPTPVSEFNIKGNDGQDLVYAGRPGGDSLPITILSVSDQTTNLVYYMESYSPYIYVFDASGNYLRNIRINCYPLKAVFDSAARNILIFGAPLDVANGYITNLSQYNGKYEIVSTATETTVSSNNTGLLPTYLSPGAFGLQPTGIQAQALMQSFAGIYKQSTNAAPWFVLTIWTSASTLPIHLQTSGAGTSWIRVFGPNPQLPFTVSKPIVGCSTENPNGIAIYTTFPFESFGSVIPQFALSIQAGDQKFTEIWYWRGDGSGTPIMTYQNWRLAQVATNTDHPPICHAMYVNKWIGTGILVISEGPITGNPVFKYYMFDGKFAFTYADLMEVHTIGLPANYIAAQPRLNQGFGFTDGVSSINQSVIQYGSYVTSPGGTYTEQFDVLIDLLTTVSFTYTTLATIPAIRGCNQSQGGPTLAASSIPAGIYRITTVGIPTARNYTFNLVGLDFPLYSASYVLVKITNVSLKDSVYPNFIGPLLYTSPSVEGAIAARYPPPKCDDIEIFRTYAFFANCTSPANLKVTLLDLAAILPTDLIYIGNTLVSPGSVEDIQNRIFKVYSTGAGNIVKDTEDTIASLSNVVNSNWVIYKSTVMAVGPGTSEYASFFITGIGFTQVAFFRHVDQNNVVKTTAFAPYDIVVSPIPQPNVLQYSAANIPDAAPVFNSLRIGQDSKPIRRIKASRDALFIFKDDGCFILRGYDPPWQVDPYDLTLHLAAKDSLARQDNALYGLFTRGVFRVSDASVELLSLPIQDQLERYMAGDERESAEKYGFGLGDNADHKYLLWLPTEAGAAALVADETYVYDTFTQAWTKWYEPSYHVLSYQDARLFFTYREPIESWINPVTKATTLIRTIDYFNAIYAEQKTLTDLDLNDGPRFWKAESGQEYFNDGSVVLVDTINQQTRQMQMRFGGSNGGFSVEAGDYIEFAYDVNGTPTANWRWGALILNDAGYQEPFNVSANIPNEIAAQDYYFRVYRGTSQRVVFAPTFPESPAATNHFSEIALSFRRAYWNKFTIEIGRPIEASDPARPIGYIDFNGILHFGVQDTALNVIDPLQWPEVQTRIAIMNFLRTYVPRDQQRGTVIFAGYTVRVANHPSSVNGLYIVMTPGPTSFTRR
jgi:hypothetical protein